MKIAKKTFISLFYITKVDEGLILNFINKIFFPQVNGRVVAGPEILDDYPGADANRSCRDVIFLILFIAFCVGGVSQLYIKFGGVI